ncbi:MAG: glycosyl amidation-associated protein WbuZ [Candidatus Hydrogenedentota bacterium]
MLKKRLIPVLLLKNGRMIKTIQFEKWRDVGHPITAAKIYDAQGADELIFLDISASNENREILFDIISTVAEECFMPLTVGGGVRTIEDIRRLLSSGADKVSINTQAVECPEFIKEAALNFGSANIVVSIDVRIKENGNYEVYTHSGKKATGLNAIDWAVTMAKYGAGEILITSIDREGTMQGYDLKLISSIADNVNVSTIAHGGAGTLQHFVEAIKIGNASAVAAGSIFHFTDQNLIKARTYMKEANIDVKTVWD